jgi:hypothetical protein
VLGFDVDILLALVLDPEMWLKYLEWLINFSVADLDPHEPA